MIGKLGPENARDAFRRIDRPEIEAFVVPGGNFPTMVSIPEWERRVQEAGRHHQPGRGVGDAAPDRQQGPHPRAREAVGNGELRARADSRHRRGRANLLLG